MNKFISAILLSSLSLGVSASETPARNNVVDKVYYHDQATVEKDTIRSLAITMYSKSTCRVNIDHLRKKINLETYSDMTMKEAFKKAEVMAEDMATTQDKYPCDEMTKELASINVRY